MQCKDSRNRKAASFLLSVPSGTTVHQRDRAPPDPRGHGLLRPAAGAHVHAWHPAHPACGSQRHPTSHAAWRLSLPHCSSRPPAVPCRCRTWNAMSPADPSALGLARNCHRESRSRRGRRGRGVQCPHQLHGLPPTVGSPNAASGTV